MVCKVSLAVNEGSHNSIVSKYGARGFSSVQNAVLNPATLEYKTNLSKNIKSFSKKYTKISAREQAYNYAYSGTNFNIARLAHFTSKLKNNQGIYLPDNLDVIGAVEMVFSSESRVLSSTTSNNSRIIIESDRSVEDSSDRTFFEITEDEKSLLRESVKNEENPQEAFEEAAAFLISSALFRGFDVVLKTTLPDVSLQKGIEIFSKDLGGGIGSVTRASMFVGKPGVIKVNNAQGFISAMDRGTSAMSSVPKVMKTSPTMISILNESDRTIIKNTKNKFHASRRKVAESVLGVFTKFMPGIETEVLTQYEIETEYGALFADKKGFVIGNKIVLNLEHFDSSTAFHEFGHFYIKWLSENNADAYTNLMNFVQEKYASDMVSYETAYSSTGITFSQENIAEEVFVDKLGMLVAQNLDSYITEEALAENNLDSSAFTATVEKFTENFLIHLTSNRTTEALSSGKFDLNSTIETMFNVNPGLVSTRFNRDTLTSLQNFFVPGMNSQAIYNSLSARGVIRRIGNRVQLTDGNGNAMNLNGEMENVTYPIDSAPYEFLNYLNTMAHLATAQFSAKVVPNDILDNLITMADRELAGSKKGDFKGVTRTLSEDIKDEFEIEKTIYRMVYNDLKNTYIIREDLDKNRLTPEQDTAAAEHARDFMKDPRNSGDVQVFYDEKAKDFEFKTNEGTFMHDINELFLRTLNYSMKIEYNTKLKDGSTRDRKYFSTHIQTAIQKGDKEFFEKYFFSRIENKESTEFKEFQASYEKIFSKLTEKDITAVTLLLNSLNSFLDTEVFGQIKGPITILPELTLASKALGVVGRIDLLILDGDGIAHVFDYKTKESGSLDKWDFNSKVTLRDEFSSYADNARASASVQTSIYKLILLENGISSAPAKVIYIESTKENQASGKEKERFRYLTKKMHGVSLTDMSAEAAQFFIRKGRKSDILETKNLSQDIESFMEIASGGIDIDRVGELDQTATEIYKRALKKQNNKADDSHFAAVMAALSGGATSGKKEGGLVITLEGRHKITLPAGLTAKESVDHIIELLKDRKDMVAGVKQLETMFYGEATGSMYAKKNLALGRLLRGTNEVTHSFEKISSDINYGNFYSGYAIVKNKFSGESRLIILNDDTKRNIKFSGGKSHSTIYGNFISNRLVDALIPGTKWENTNHNMRLIKAGLLIMKKKSEDPNFKISTVMANYDYREQAISKLLDIDSIIEATLFMVEQARKSGENIPKSILDLVSNPNITNPRNYTPDPVKALSEFLDSSLETLPEIKKLVGKGEAKERTERLSDAIRNFDTDQNYDLLRSSLNDFRISLEQKLDTNKKRNDSYLWQMTNEVILSLSKFNFNLVPTESGAVSRYLFTTSKASNTYQMAYNKKIAEGSLNIREEYTNIMVEHNRLMTVMAKKKGVDLESFGAGMVTASMKKVFSDLYIDPTNTDRTKAYTLRDYKTDKKLTKEQKDYLEFIHITMEKMANKSSFTADKTLPAGWLPLTMRSRQSILQDSLDLGQVKKIFRGKNEEYHKDTVPESANKDFSVANKYKNQLAIKEDEEGIQFNDSRRYILGLDSHGEEVEDAEDFPLDMTEDNIQNAFGDFLMASLETVYYRDVAAFGRALYEQVTRTEETLGDTDLFNGLRETMVIMHKRLINHMTQENSSEWVKRLNSFTTTATILGTVSQGMLEAISNPLSTANTYMYDKMYGMMFDGKRDFSMSSYRAAVAIVTNPLNTGGHALITKLDQLYGITNSDLANVKNMMATLEKNFLFTTDTLMFANKLFMDTWQKITFVSYMIEDGSWDAHALDSMGRLTYDVKKDKKFFDKTATKEVQDEKESAYNAVKEQMRSQRGGLTGLPSDSLEDRELVRAYSTYQANYIKELITEAYSSLDESSKSLLTYLTIGGLLGKMKTWLFPKISKYFQKPLSASKTDTSGVLIRVEDPNHPKGYRMEFQGQGTEGIFFTLKSIALQVAEYKLALIKGDQSIELREYQKKNLAKLTTDVMQFATISLLIALADANLDDETKKNYWVKLGAARLGMTLGDVGIMGVYDVLTGGGSMIVGLSVLTRAIDSLFNLFGTLAMAPFSDETSGADVWLAIDHVFDSVYAPYRSASELVQENMKEE